MEDIVETLKVKLKDSVAPPLCVEVILMDGRSYFVNSVAEASGGIISLRIWDMRAMSERDVTDMLAKMNTMTRQRHYDEKDFHDKLAWGTLWIPRTEIRYFLEWHDRIWPMEEVAETRKAGFTFPLGSQEHPEEGD